MRTQVGIIGAGPAGLLLAQLLAVRGIDSVVLENRSRDYVAGPHPCRDPRAGHGRRADRGRRGGAAAPRGPAPRRHLPAVPRSPRAPGLSRSVRPLGLGLRADRGGQGPDRGPARGGPADRVRDLRRPRCTTSRPTARASPTPTAPASQQVLECDVVAGCDGFHGPSRPMLPAALQQTWVRDYPFAWLGILADVAPSTDELIYAWHPDGFALHSMRSPSVSRLYLQVDPDERIESWSDDRIWSELQHRMAFEGWQLQTGPDHRPVDHADAQLRQRPDAPRPALPRRRRRAHRAADRRQGAEPRRRRRHRAVRGADRAAARTGAASSPTPTPTRRCGGCGGPRTSPGG